MRNGADVGRGIRRVLSSNGIPSRTSAALVPVRDEPAVRPFLDALSLLVYARKRGEEGAQPRRAHARPPQKVQKVRRRRSVVGARNPQRLRS